MQNRMSLQSRKELAHRVRERYNQADGKEKTKILNGLIASTGYGKKYAITLLNSIDMKSTHKPKARGSVILALR